ncbi:alpha/beta hydrolase [Nocardioides gilvus]|uniref:alpha/beta hydrolase n=1 Tax=Nocardioides gilvus TaxID=1735589 RepID=UPI000D742060|nr:alpha/beta hydrolase [Nocardioides gilvus]
MSPCPFLLVHGAFRGGWAWSKVRPGLVAAGHDVFAPSLRGAGERVGEIDRVLTLDTWVDEVQALVEAEDLHDLVLVGHSQGGLVTTALAARVPDRIRILVHLDAAVPGPGERGVDLGPGGGDLPPRGAVVPPRLPAVDAEYDAATVAWMSSRMTPTPIGPSLDPVPGVPARVRQEYLFCRRTPSGYPSTMTRGRLDSRGVPYGILEAGHDAPITAPEVVLTALLGLLG